MKKLRYTIGQSGQTQICIKQKDSFVMTRLMLFQEYVHPSGITDSSLGVYNDASEHKEKEIGMRPKTRWSTS